jgi:hypothetical protein
MASSRLQLFCWRKCPSPAAGRQDGGQGISDCASDRDCLKARVATLGAGLRLRLQRGTYFAFYWAIRFDWGCSRFGEYEPLKRHRRNVRIGSTQPFGDEPRYGRSWP